jgi:hypothetical protein
MVGRALLATLVTMVSWTAQAEHAVAPDAKLVPAVTREVCTESVWGFDEIRTDCRVEVRAGAAAQSRAQGHLHDLLRAPDLPLTAERHNGTPERAT